MANGDEKGGQGGSEGGEPEARVEEEVRPGTSEIREEVSARALKEEGKAESGKKTVNILGVKAPNAEQVYKNLGAVLKIVEEKLGIPVSLDDLYFKKFPGEIAGEAEGGKIKIDPILLMHPIVRLAHVIAHEAAHREHVPGEKVENEAMVEAYIKAMGFSEIELTEKYQTALGNFHEFVEKVSEKGESAETVIQNLYKMYYTGNYENIYELYEEKCIENLESKDEKEEAFKFFEEVFPELEVRGDSWFNSHEVEVEV